MCLFSLLTTLTKLGVCNKDKNNVYIGVNKLNYFSISINKKIAKAELEHLSVIIVKLQLTIHL